MRAKTAMSLKKLKAGRLAKNSKVVAGGSLVDTPVNFLSSSLPASVVDNEEETAYTAKPERTTETSEMYNHKELPRNAEIAQPSLWSAPITLSHDAMDASKWISEKQEAETTALLGLEKAKEIVPAGRKKLASDVPPVFFAWVPDVGELWSPLCVFFILILP